MFTDNDMSWKNLSFFLINQSGKSSVNQISFFQVYWAQ